MQLCWGHSNTALAEYALMLAASGLGLLAISRPDTTQVATLGVAAVACGVLT